MKICDQNEARQRFEYLEAVAVLFRWLFTDQFVFAGETRQTGEDVSHRGFRNVCQRLLGEERLMRGDDHVWHGDQTRQRIILNDVS